MKPPPLPPGRLHPGYSCCGIDTSRWNEISDIEKTKAMGVKFIIARGGYGVFEDKKLKQTQELCKSENIPNPIYWYWLPTLKPSDIVRAARSSLHYGSDIFLDIEKNKVDRWPQGMTASFVTNHILNTLDEFDNVFGRETGIYTSPGFWFTWINKLKIPKFNLIKRELWVAQWKYSFSPRPFPLPYKWPKWDFWQFSGNIGPWSGKAKQFGITKCYSVDVDAYHGSEEEFIHKFGSPVAETPA